MFQKRAINELWKRLNSHQITSTIAEKILKTIHASLVLAKFNFKVAVHTKKQIQIRYSIAVL